MREGLKYHCRKISLKRIDGIGVIEIILILVIIIGLILIFRNQIEAIIQTAFESITTNSEGINSEIQID